MVNLENVSKFIIQDLCLHVPEGVCVGLIGASGAGKTTLLKLICGLLEPENGYVRTMGKEPVAAKRQYGRDLSVFLVGHSALESTDTVKQSFVLRQSIYGLPRERFWQEYTELAECFGFDKYQNEALKSLSLGQRMRVELAATLIGNPRLILLDEPNVGLDENGKAILWELLDRRCRQGATVLVASHNLTEIAKVCSRIALLEKGKLLYYGSERNLRSKLASMETMELQVTGKLPDLKDLPVKVYGFSENKLRLSYDSNYLSAAEILGLLLPQTQVAEVNIIKPDLADIVMDIQKESKNNMRLKKQAEGGDAK